MNEKMNSSQFAGHGLERKEDFIQHAPSHVVFLSTKLQVLVKDGTRQGNVSCIQREFGFRNDRFDGL